MLLGTLSEKTTGFHGPYVTERHTVYTQDKYMYINIFDEYFTVNSAWFSSFLEEQKGEMIAGNSLVGTHLMAASLR